ncbi:hypothetical protein ACFV2H_17295 [Streptomyces sp. NPDC059629]|uniref:hypothetical protein n=1 Tax=Streptomyces sp. NPDC059629 TaxID=3346889 RepID=UPI0036B00DE9
MTVLIATVGREGEQWLDRHVGKLARCEVRPPVTDLASAVTYLRREREVTLGTAARKDWNLVVIERATNCPRLRC